MNSIADLIAEIVPEVLACPQLQIALEQRAKFEGWLKIELSHALRLRGQPVRLAYQYRSGDNKYRADLSIGTEGENRRSLIMLKTINTNFRFPEVESRARPITKNIHGLIEDVRKLSHRPENTDAYILFAMFPVSANQQILDIQVETCLARVSRAGADFLMAGFVPRGSNWGVAWFLAKIERLG